MRDVRLGGADDRDDQDAVMGRQRPPAFREDAGMRDAFLIAHHLNVVDDVVGVFLQRVVHAARLFVAVTGVVDRQPPPTSIIFSGTPMLTKSA